MSTDKYFEREYNFLQTSGEEFSKKHPTLGRGFTSANVKGKILL